MAAKPKPKLRKKYALQRADILALKNATHILVKSEPGQPAAKIAALKVDEQPNSTPSITEWSFVVTADYHFIHTDYKEPTEAKLGFLSVNVDWEFQTFAGSLNIGDELEVIWLPDAATTSHTYEAGLHVDMMKFIIYRDEFRFHYRLGWVTAPNDSTRMIGPLNKPLDKKHLKG